MSLWQVARDKGSQVARTLNMRKTADLVDRKVRRLFDKALAEMAATPQISAKARLRGLYQHVRKLRGLQTAVVLLDLAWRLPPGSRLESDVIDMICDCYLETPPDPWGRLIADELQDRQLHPFPSVRRVACRVRVLEPVEAPELAELKELERGYPDVRLSIAERIIRQSQVEFLDAALKYLTNVSQRPGVDIEEVKAAKGVYSLLVTKLAKSERALKILYDTYLDEYELDEPRGHLMRALAGYGDALVPQLMFHHQQEPRRRTAIEHLLGQIVGRGGLQATQALLTILGSAGPQDVGRTCKFLWNGLVNVAGHAEQSSAGAIREVVVDALPQLERRRYPELRRFVQDFLSLEWGIASVAALIDRVLDGTATDAQRQQLRRLARPAAKRLLEAAEDATRDPLPRRRALEALASIRANTFGLGARLWSIFVRTDIDEVRIGVLHALAGLGLDPGSEARAVLFDLSKTGSAKLGAAILASWDGMFCAVGLADPATGDGGTHA